MTEITTVNGGQQRYQILCCPYQKQTQQKSFLQKDFIVYEKYNGLFCLDMSYHT